MRKKLFVCVITALFLFISASPWEGAAATAPEGELPGNGRYIATNSFPKNTIVDIVNIETNKSTRVIVANNLDSPGLLAIVSREAAELIGMRPGSISRIRMTQPSDPVAYVRFTESLTTGIPDYDSGNVITEEFVNPAVPPSRAASSGAGEDDAAAYEADPTSSSFAAVSETGFPAYVLEPEWSGAASGTRSARDIVDLPEYTAQEKKSEETPSIIDAPESITETKPAAAKEDSEKIAENLPEDDYEDYFEEPEEIAEYPEDEYYEDDFFEEPEEIAEYTETEDEYYEDDFFEEPKEIAEYNIVPTDNRPPTNIYGIDPAFIIPEVTRAEKPEIVNSTRIITDSRVVNDSRVEPDFSIPRKNELSRGSYYVQLVAFDTVESVENSINRIDQNYKQKFQPFVYKDSDQLYHVLLGPLNQGESYAVLQRFKSIGYKDAFVRVVR